MSTVRALQRRSSRHTPRSTDHSPAARKRRAAIKSETVRKMRRLARLGDDAPRRVTRFRE